MQKTIWTIIILLLVIGYVPYKFPKNPTKRRTNELLVNHQEATCTTDFEIVNGSLQIPSELIYYFPNGSTNIKLAVGKSPFDPIDEKQINWYLITENNFIISGNVVGVDSLDKQLCGHNYPVFKIEEWSPTKYFPNYCSFSFPIFLLYFASIILAISTSIILFFVQRKRVQK